MSKLDLRRGTEFTGLTVPFLVHDGQGRFVMHKRSQKCRDEQGNWDIGSGAVEFGEALDKAVRREVKEEYCADALKVVPLGHFEIFRNNNGRPTHWIAFSHAVKVNPAEIANGDPEKIEELGWYKFDELPSPLHSQVMKTLNAAREIGLI